jgi:Tfp pilus assembly protein FimT
MGRHREAAGVTLIEVAVLLALIAILAGLSMQGAGLLQTALNANRTKGASDQLVAAIRYTRQRAISDAQDYCIATRTSDGVGQFQVYTGGRSGTSCSGTSVEAAVNLTGAATVGNFAFRFTPVSTVDPVGPTNVVVTRVGDGSPCSVTITVTPEGGVQIPGTYC